MILELFPKVLLLGGDKLVPVFLKKRFVQHPHTSLKNSKIVVISSVPLSLNSENMICRAYLSM